MAGKRMKWAAAALCVTLLAAGAFAEAAHSAHRGRGMFGGPMAHVFRQLDLTGAQRGQMRDILAKEKPALRPLMKQMAQNRYQIAQLEINGAFDEAQVRALATQQAQSMSDLIVQRARVESELIQVLTPDQKTKLNQILANRQQKFLDHAQGQGQGPAQGQAPNQ